MNIHAGSGNAIFGEVTQRLSGNDRLRERLCDLNFEIGPTAFFQVNPWQAALMYRRVEQLAGLASPGGVAWDLYCGIGQISMMLARQGFRVFGVEENPAAVEDAKLNSRRNGLDERTTFLAARVEDSETDFPAWARKPEVIVVNPSRRGLHESARSHLAHVLRQSPDTRLIYVSCEVETMARDLAAMRHAGFRLRQVEAFDMFAHTDNLEWLAVMTS
jgi:23S rRNA (uracil1939-C5)-methyltransferase